MNEKGISYSNDLKPIKEPSSKDGLMKFLGAAGLSVLVLGISILIVLAVIRGINDPNFVFILTLYLAISMVSLVALFTFINILHRYLRERGDIKQKATVEEISVIIKDLAKRKATHKEFKFLEKYFNSLRTIEDTDNHLSLEERNLLKKMLKKNDVIPHLEKTARFSNRKWKRVHAILMLGWVGAEEKQNFLAEALRDPDKDIGYAAAHALSELKTKESYESLLGGLELEHLSSSRIATFLINSRYPYKLSILKKYIKKVSPKFRAWYTYLIGELRDLSSFKTLEMLAKDKNPAVRANVAFSLGEFKNKKATPLIKDLLHDKDWIVRTKAAKAAEKINDKELLKSLFPLLKDKIWWIRENAAKAIEKQGKAVLPQLKRQLLEKDHFARNMSAEILTGIGEVKRQIKNLSTKSKRREAKVFLSRIGTADAADYLFYETRSKNPETQIDIIEILEINTSPGATEGLMYFKNSANPMVAKRAAQALKNKKRRHHE